MKTTFLSFSPMALFAALSLLCTGNALAQTSTLKGTVTDNERGVWTEMRVTLCRNEMCFQGTMTDSSGNYEFRDVQPGVYEIHLDCLGDSKKLQPNEGRSELDFSVHYEFGPDGTTSLPEVVNVHIVIPREGPTPGSDGVEAEETLSGSRARGFSDIYYIDGVRVAAGGRLPFKKIGQLEVITGTIPCEFEDISGGIIFSDTPETGALNPK